MALVLNDEDEKLIDSLRHLECLTLADYLEEQLKVATFIQLWPALRMDALFEEPVERFLYKLYRGYLDVSQDELITIARYTLEKWAERSPPKYVPLLGHTILSDAITDIWTWVSLATSGTEGEESRSKSLNELELLLDEELVKKVHEEIDGYKDNHMDELFRDRVKRREQRVVLSAIQKQNKP